LCPARPSISTPIDRGRCDRNTAQLEDAVSPASPQALHFAGMHTSHCFLVVALLSLVVSERAVSQSLYVADKLVLNVYSEANQAGARVATIETGDAVEELERADNFVRVRLADGREGWVGANYLSSEPPAIVKLKQLLTTAPAPAPAKQSADELARLQKQNAALNAELAELKKKSSATQVASAAAPAAEVATAKAELVVEPQRSEVAEPNAVKRNDWWAWALAVVAAGGGGFVAGYQTLGRRVRERFGGVKVY
jgi:SH3 domain protein